MFQFEVSAAEIERNQLKRRMIITKSSSDSRWFAEEQMIGAQEHWLIMHRMFPADFWLSSVRRTNY
jgi:hypothetical protein